MAREKTKKKKRKGRGKKRKKKRKERKRKREKRKKGGLMSKVEDEGGVISSRIGLKEGRLDRRRCRLGWGVVRVVGRWRWVVTREGLGGGCRILAASV